MTLDCLHFHPTIKQMVKFMFSKKATKNYKIFTVDLTLTALRCQINEWTLLAVAMFNS